MSDYQELCEFLKPLDTVCIIPQPSSTITKFFLIYNFWPIFMGYVMLGLTVVKCDYVFLLLTITNFMDNWINYSLRSTINNSSLFQPSTCPLLDDQMPALSSQRIAVLYTVIWFLATVTYPTRMGKANILFINFSAVTALYSRLFLGFSTPEQMIVGALVGILEGVCFSLVFYYLKIHKYDRWICHYLSYWYQNVADEFIDHRECFDDVHRSAYTTQYTKDPSRPDNCPPQKSLI